MVVMVRIPGCAPEPRLYLSAMSFAEIKAELPNLTPAELAELEIALSLVKISQRDCKPSEFFGRMKGTVIFGPGWDEPEPPATWNAHRDDLPL
jgi:hypothetical protein